MVGDSQIGKTSLMVKYVEGSFEYVFISWDCADIQRRLHSDPRCQLYGEGDQHQEYRNYILCMSTIVVNVTDAQIWDLGGQREFVSMLPLVCNDAVAILFMFDLTRKTTLNSVKEWYRQARGFNKVSLCYVDEW
jgi:GTP-binding protein of the ras superfamily involved in termination of M-phase